MTKRAYVAYTYVSISSDVLHHAPVDFHRRNRPSRNAAYWRDETPNHWNRTLTVQLQKMHALQIKILAKAVLVSKKSSIAI